MDFSTLVAQTAKAIKSNAPEILTALGIGGLATTSVLAAKGGYRAARKMSEQSPYLSTKEKAKLTWKEFVPAALSGAATVACIVGVGKANGKRTAAAVAAYSFTEKMFSEYKEKVVETLGENKEQKLRDEIAQARIDRNPPGTREVIVIGKGEVLCREDYTDRYFMCDPEILRRAENEVNHQINTLNYVSMSEFYDMIGLQHTGISDYNGWNYEKLMELSFSYGGADDGRPCLVFEYNYVKPLKS